MSGRRLGLAGIALVVVGAVLIGGSAVLGANDYPGTSGWLGGMMGGGTGHGMMGAGYGPGMMGGYRGIPSIANGAQPGDQGFVAGTAQSPRVLRVVAGPGYTFEPSAITVQKGETIRFEVTTMGPLVHEFMVGPTDAVATDQTGTPEVAEIGMMETRSLIYTFDGSGPFAFACHAPGHYEAGMSGTITVVG